MIDRLALLRSRARPDVYRLESNLFVASFWLMKLGVAISMIDSARATGRLLHEGHLVETTSGQTGYALALAGRKCGCRVTLVGDPAIDLPLRNLLELLGAKVIIVDEKSPTGSYQAARLLEIQRVLQADPAALWVSQYDNCANPQAYVEAARVVAEQVGQVDCLVCTVGTGGSLCGAARWLRSAGHAARAVAVDTHNSVIFGQRDGPRQLRGLGNSIRPGNVDYSLIDEVHWVEAGDAFCAARTLLDTYGLDLGGTSGAAYMVARHVAATNPDKSVVFFAPDRSERYLSTVFNREWCAKQGLLADSIPAEPYEVKCPQEARGGWAKMQWNRRPFVPADLANPA
jgi:cysteine synthase A